MSKFDDRSVKPDELAKRQKVAQRCEEPCQNVRRSDV